MNRRGFFAGLVGLAVSKPFIEIAGEELEQLVPGLELSLPNLPVIELEQDFSWQMRDSMIRDILRLCRKGDFSEAF